MGLENILKRGKSFVKKTFYAGLISLFLTCFNPVELPEQTPTNSPNTPTPTQTISPTPLPTPTGYDYTTTTKIVASKNISVNGGSLEVTASNSFLQGSKLTIPKGALDSKKNISIAEVNNPPALPDGLGYIGSAIDLKPDGTNFDISSTIIIPYDDCSLSDAGISSDSNLELYSYNKLSENWTKVNDFSLDTTKNTITANINHFSYYAITCLNAIPPEDLGTPQPGDLLYTLGAFWDEGHPIFFNNWMPGHVGIYTGEKTYSGTGLASEDVKKFEKYNIIEALWDGVQYSYYDIPNATETFENELNTFNGGNLYMGAREPKDWTLTPQQREEIISYVESHIGKSYAWKQTIGSAFGMLPGSEVKGENKNQVYNCVGLAEASYEFAGINFGEGLVSKEQEEGVITPAEQYNATNPARGPLTFNIGERGPAGGWIFYDKGYYDEWRYLEVAPYNQTSGIWGTSGIKTPGAYSKAIGKGKQNTLEIITVDPASNKAADKCFDLIIFYNDIYFDDWFLPSALELQQIDINLSNKGIGNLSGTYWSSSGRMSGGGTKAWHMDFEENTLSASNKGNSYYIRAVRQF